MKYLIISILLCCFFSCRTQLPKNDKKDLPSYKIGSYPIEYITASPKEEAICLIENKDTILVKYTPTYAELREFYRGINTNEPSWSCQLDDFLKTGGSNLLLEKRYTNVMNVFLETISRRNNLIIGDEMKIADIYKKLMSFKPLIASYDDKWKECEDLYFSSIYTANRLRNIDSCQLKEMQKMYNNVNWIKKKTKNTEYFFTQNMCHIAENSEFVLNPKLYYRMRFEYEDKRLIPKLSLMNPLALFSEAPSI